MKFDKESENWIIRVTIKLTLILTAMYAAAFGLWIYGAKAIEGAKKLWSDFTTKRKEKKQRRGYTEMNLEDC